MRFLLGHSMPLSCQCDISFPPSREEGSLRSLARSPPSTHLSSFGSLHNVSSRVSSEEHAVTVVIRANFPVVSLRFSEMYVASKYVAHNYERTMDGRTDFAQMACGWVCLRAVIFLCFLISPSSGPPPLRRTEFDGARNENRSKRRRRTLKLSSESWRAIGTTIAL